MHSGAAPFSDSTNLLKIMNRVIGGERPSRPLAGDPGVLEPSDEVWDLITRCWSTLSTSRPLMYEVCEALQRMATPDEVHTESLWRSVTRRDGQQLSTD
jgi:hypothetical protein